MFLFSPALPKVDVTQWSRNLDDSKLLTRMDPSLTRKNVFWNLQNHCYLAMWEIFVLKLTPSPSNVRYHKFRSCSWENHLGPAFAYIPRKMVNLKKNIVQLIKAVSYWKVFKSKLTGICSQVVM